MDVETGRLVMVSDSISKDMRDALDAGIPEGDGAKLTPVPDHLIREAIKELAGKKEVVIDMEASTPLATWTRQQRRAHERKVVKAARRSAG